MAISYKRVILKLSGEALGAVGLAFPVINLILVLFMGISTGATIVVSQYFGAKDRKNLSNAVGTSIMLTVISGILMSIVGALVTRPLLILLETPPEMMEMAVDYLRIIMLGLVGCNLYNIWQQRNNVCLSYLHHIL